MAESVRAQWRRVPAIASSCRHGAHELGLRLTAGSGQAHTAGPPAGSQCLGTKRATGAAGAPGRAAVPRRPHPAQPLARQGRRRPACGPRPPLGGALPPTPAGGWRQGWARPEAKGHAARAHACLPSWHRCPSLRLSRDSPFSEGVTAPSSHMLRSGPPRACGECPPGATGQAGRTPRPPPGAARPCPGTWGSSAAGQRPHPPCKGRHTLLLSTNAAIRGTNSTAESGGCRASPCQLKLHVGPCLLKQQLALPSEAAFSALPTEAAQPCLWVPRCQSRTAPSSSQLATRVPSYCMLQIGPWWPCRCSRHCPVDTSHSLQEGNRGDGVGWGEGVGSSTWQEGRWQAALDTQKPIQGEAAAFHTDKQRSWRSKALAGPAANVIKPY